MKIVNLETFLSLPSGTIYSKYEPCCFDGLMMKGDSLMKTNDFIYQNLIGNIKAPSSEDFCCNCDKMEQGESVELDFDFMGRDGLFEEDQLFAIYENNDIKKLIKALKNGRR